MEEQDSNADSGDVQLADMIHMLRHELQRAQEKSHKEGEAILFETEKVELELKVALTRTAKGDAGVKFWVVNAGGGLEQSGATTHTFKLTLKPVSRGNRDPIVVAAETGEGPSGR